MPNPLFNALSGRPQNNMMSMIQQFNQFRQTFNGDPRAKVQELLNSGQMSQEQYNQLSQMANQMSQFMR